KKSVKEKDVRTIYRIASLKDLEKFESTRNKEMNTLYKTKEIVQDMGLEMKLTDVEYQADNTKATFYYSADERVDFRELIKVLANEFRIRIEMRQISLRQEAGRLGGIGSCGRELCCSTWLTDFKSVSTAAARYQKLSLNPSKLSGQCGRLKCCLNYELDTYVEALKDIPEIDRPLLTEKGEARLQKTDIFRRIMWFGYDGENTWHPLEVSRVDEIIALNKKKKKPATLAENSLDLDKTDGGGLNSDLERLDNKYKNKSGSKNKRRRKSNNKRRNNRKNSPQGNATNQKRSPKKQKK
ncbi:MAG: regulatory iron-sulfur-containing complex subunit RicT, partial [Bacteroidota bacterium]